MTDKNHPITPPPEMLQQWATDYWGNPGESIGEGERYIATQAARWGANQELEACVDYLCDCHTSWDEDSKLIAGLRAARRPQPPSLKKTLLARVVRIPGEGADSAYLQHWLENESQRLVDALHKAIDSLPD